MLCYVMLCYVVLCYVMLRCVILCYVMFCYVMSCYRKVFVLINVVYIYFIFLVWLRIFYKWNKCMLWYKYATSVCIILLLIHLA
jgi:hypothetical protein